MILRCRIYSRATLFTLVLLLAGASLSLSAPANVIGRWDLTIGPADSSYPSWLEITRKEGQLSGRFVGRVGSVRPITKIAFENGKLTFSLPVQYEKFKTDMSFDAALSPSGDKLTGKTKRKKDNQ